MRPPSSWRVHLFEAYDVWTLGYVIGSRTRAHVRSSGSLDSFVVGKSRLSRKDRARESPFAWEAQVTLLDWFVLRLRFLFTQEVEYAQAFEGKVLFVVHAQPM